MKMTKFITLLLSCVLIISTFAGCRKINGGMSSGDLSNATSTVYGIVDIVESENSSDIQSADADTTSSDSSQGSSSDDGTASSGDSDANSSSNVSSIFTENIVSVGGDGNSSDGDDEDEPVTFIEPDESGDTDSNSNPEETGYNGQTFSTVPNDKTGNVKTVTIAAGGSVFYKIMGVSNKILTINDSNAYVVYNGTKYSANNGVLSFTVVSDELSSAQILFEIGNKGSKAQGFTINFASPKGSRDNPEEIDSVENTFTTNIAEGNQQGYYYSYAATKNGKIRFYIISDTKSGMLSVDKIINPKLGVVQQRNSTETEEDYVKTDKNGTYIEFDVKSGDQFTITVSPNAKPGSYPAVTVEWKIIYS